MTLDSILKNLDPVISQTLDRALSDKDISVEQGIELVRCQRKRNEYDSKGRRRTSQTDSGRERYIRGK